MTDRMLEEEERRDAVPENTLAIVKEIREVVKELRFIVRVITLGIIILGLLGIFHG